MGKATHTFQGMDTDTADHFLKEGSYRDALNIHISSSEGDGMFSVENIKGNTLVSYSLPTGINKVIGSHEDIINKCVYYFLSNYTNIGIASTSGSGVTTDSPHGLSLSGLVNISGISGRTNILGKWIVSPTSSTTFDVLNPLTYITPSLQSVALTGTSGASGSITKYKHSILKYDFVTNTISLIYQHSRLNFDPDYVVTGTALVNGVLHWSDKVNPPRSLIIADAPGYGSFFVESMVDFIRIPPTKEMSCVGKWVNESGTEVPYIAGSTLPNNMNDKSYQFRYRYIYMDNSRSVWSPYSATIATGYIDAKKNRIDLTISNEETSNYLYFSKVIKAIEIAFRDSVTTNLKYIDRVAFPTAATSLSYVFMNDIAYTVIDSAESSRDFDSVPLNCGSLGSVQNRVFQGDCTEGFDVDPTQFSITALTNGGTLAKNIIKWKRGETFDIGIVFYDRASRKSGVYKLGRINMGVFVAPSFVLTGTPPIWATHYNIVRSNTLKKSFFVQGFALITKSNADEFEIFFNSVNGDVSYVAQEGDYLIILVTNTYSFTSNLYRYKVLRNSSDEFGNPTIVLKNATGANAINVDKSNSFGPAGTFVLVEIFSPSTNDTQLYYETPFKFPIKDPGTAQRTFSGTDAFGTIRLYNYVSGDVYRRNLNDAIIYHSRVTVSVQAINFIPNTTLSITINGDNYIGGSWTSTNGMTEEIMARSLVDQINGAGKAYKAFIFYTGKETSPQVRNTIARFIVYSTAKGASGNINVSASTFNVISGFKNGIFTIPNGTVSGTSAQNSIDSSGIIESMVNNDTISGWDNNTGRPGISLREGDREVRRKTLIRFGGTALSNTQINNINTFEFIDQKDLPNNGAVTKLIAASNNSAEGTVLLAVQENEINSLYIGQSVIKNAGGGQNISVTDSVIGTVNPLQKLVGSINPESIVQNNGTIYGFDALRGIVWRYGQDGLTLISEELGGGGPAGMRAFFYGRSQYLLSLPIFKCFGGIDPYSNEYVLTIPNTDAEKTTVVWSEKINRWTSFMSFVGEGYQKINTGFVSFLNGQLWLHRSNSAYNNFYGVQYQSKLKFICNQDPLISKILNRVEEVSKGAQWDCTDISTPAGQSSELLGLYDMANPNNLPADWTQYENRYSAVVMRDKNTPNMEASDYPLLNGDEIRSDVFSVLLMNNKTTRQNLYVVDLFYENSYKIS